MTARQSAAVEAAQRQWEKAPADNKPSVAELARKHKVTESTIHRARARWIAAAKEQK